MKEINGFKRLDKEEAKRLAVLHGCTQNADQLTPGGVAMELIPPSNPTAPILVIMSIKDWDGSVEYSAIVLPKSFCMVEALAFTMDLSDSIAKEQGPDFATGVMVSRATSPSAN